nr:Gag-Pol polyprotein [Tanacetum cinerariifolium]
MNPWGGNAAGYGEAQNRVGNVNQGQARPGQARTVKCYRCNDKMLLMQAQENGVALDAEQLLFLAGGPNNAFDDDVDEQPIQDLALNVDNVFQAKDCDAFDSDVDEAPTAQTMLMANLSSADPITDEARPSYDSDILFKVQDHDQYLDDTCAYHEEHVMHDSVQLDHVVDLHADYTSVGNMISYDQYVKDNEVPVVHSNASSVQNDNFMMIYNVMCEPSAPSVSNSSLNAVVKNSLTAKLATYREQVELEDLGKLQPTADTGIFVGYAPSRKGPCTQSGSCNSLCTPTNKELEILFQPIFDEYLEPPRAERPGSPAHAVQALVTSAGDISSTESPYISQSIHHLNKWSKDHPLDNVIGNPSRPVSTRKQLSTDALWCLYSSVLSKIEPKNFKYVIIEDCWFQAMQDEIHEFDRL